MWVLRTEFRSGLVANLYPLSPLVGQVNPLYIRCSQVLVRAFSSDLLLAIAVPTALPNLCRLLQEWLHTLFFCSTTPTVWRKVWILENIPPPNIYQNLMTY